MRHWKRKQIPHFLFILTKEKFKEYTRILMILFFHPSAMANRYVILDPFDWDFSLRPKTFDPHRYGLVVMIPASLNHFFFSLCDDSTFY